MSKLVMIPGAVPLMIRYAESAAWLDKLAEALGALRRYTFEHLGPCRKLAS
ncbi:hypothetical protein [Burkholderia ubonensis]|uniref:hypothetical protein n=1 Tax=Burkholderia ubonensis TaxID=101571 RepID=UPI0012FB89A3|nr:hypothetical protein [Burkholderia ubonensis]